MKINKTERVILFFIIVLVVSIVFAFIDIYPEKISAYEFGKLAAAVFKNLIKVLSITCLVILGVRLLKK